MLVLVELLDQLGLTQGQVLGRVVCCIKGQADLVARADRALPVDALAVDQDLFSSPQEMPDLAGDEKLVFQKLLDRHLWQGLGQGNDVLRVFHDFIVAESQAFANQPGPRA